MPELTSFDYAIIRVVPRVERHEFVNAGVVLFCKKLSFLEARIALDPERLRAIAPDVDLETVEQHLAALPRIAAGGKSAGDLGALSQSERFHWIVAPRSAVVQSSPVHSGQCAEPLSAIEHLMRSMVLRPV